MKHYLSTAALVAVTALTLSACSSGVDNSAAGSETEISGEVTMLTPLFASDDDKAKFADVLEKFNEEYPDVTVKIDYTDYSKLNEKITAGLASGLLPDIVQIGVGWAPPLADKGVLAPLDDLGFTPEYLEETFPTAAAEAGQFDGNVYMVPFVTQGLEGVYRKDYFEAAGLDPEKPPTTWEELREAAIKTTVRSADGTMERAGFMALGDNTRQMFATLLMANGGRQFAPDGSEATFNEPEGVEALTFMDELVNEDKVFDIGFEAGTPINPILSGKAAIAFYGSYINGDDPNIVAPEIFDQLGYFAIPGNEQGESAVYLGGTFSAITAGAKNPDAAAALVKFMAEEPEAAFATTTSTYSIPSAEAAWTDPRVADAPSSAFFISVIDKAGTEGGPVTWLDTRNDFQPALESVIVGGADPKQALDELAKSADAAIQAAQ